MSRQPQPRKRHAAVGDGQKLYVWAGKGANVQVTTIESFDVSSEVWEQPRQLHGSLPDELHNVAVATDGKIAYSFGGACGTHKCLNKLYQIDSDLTSLQCRELVPTNTPPVSKRGSRMVCFNEKLVVHGGFLPKGGVTDELQLFDLKTNRWIIPPTTGDAPPLLASHTFTKIDHHKAVVFGGYSGTNRMNDIYVLDMEKWHWTKIEVSGAKPPARSVHAACCIAGPLTGQLNSLLMIVGGYDGVGGVLGDVWLLDVDKGIWSEVNLPAPITPRDCHSAVEFGSGSNSRIVVLFGGKKSPWSGDEISETTLLCFEFQAATICGSASWQITRVVKPEQLGKEKRKLNVSPPKGGVEQSLRKEQERGAEAERQVQLLKHKVAELQPQNSATSHPASKVTSLSTNTSGAVTQSSPIIDIKDVQVGKHIGQGGFGAVFEAKWRKKRVAVKVCPGNLIENLSREVEILTSLPSHSHVLTFFGITLSSDRISTLIVTELALNGSLHDYLHVKKEKPSHDQSIGWAQQIANGMQHLHNNNIVHRDLKSGNILLASGLLAKVCDFGTARVLAKTAKTTLKGTYRWMAPEIVKEVEADINKKCDVFSYGMVLYEIFACKIPYDNIPTDPLVGLAVIQGERPPVPDTLPPFLCPLLEDCWKEEPNQRPQFEAIVLAIQTESYE